MVLYLIPKLLCYILIYFAIQITLFASITGGDHAEASNADIWDEIFNLRNDEEWRALWHVERHRRCFQELENHMKWVCDKDIYKVAKKRNDRAAVAPPFLTQEKAFDFLGGRGNRGRREKRGIMDECCHGSTGCSWEEYAEYCQHHSRVRV